MRLPRTNQCPICRRSFAGSIGLWQHAKAKHKKPCHAVALRWMRDAAFSPAAPHETIASRMIEAQLQAAMRERVDEEWLLEAIA